MLINAKSSHVEQPFQAVDMTDSGQGLPQSAKFSELFASMFNGVKGKELSADKSVVQLDEESNLLLTASLNDSLEGAVLPASGLALVTEMDVNVLNDVSDMAIAKLPGLVTLQEKVLSSGSEVGQNSLTLSDSNIMGVVSKVLENQGEMPKIPLSDDQVAVSEKMLSDPYLSAMNSVHENGELIESVSSLEGGHDINVNYKVDDGSIDIDVAKPVNQVGETVIDGQEEFVQAGLVNNQNVAVNSQGMTNVTSAHGQTAVSVPPGNTQSSVVSSSTHSSSATQWSSSGSEMAQSSNPSQNSAQSNSQNNPQQSFSSPQQSMQFKEQRAQNLEQKMIVNTVDESLSKVESKDGLLGVDMLSTERRGQLPLGLQTIVVPVKSPQWGQALGQRVVFMANNQVQQAQITLNPEKLGPVQVKLHMDKEQQMHVTMNAQHLTTREAMESALPRLREMLEQSGINLASVDIGEHSNFSQNKEGSAGGNSMSLPQDESDIELSENTMTQNAITTDNIVDFYA
ncbi:flagellar hook-length control protein FliK [Thiomicrorhabdus sp. Kp2]|uniref:flagellar hook-length control protein FliK n=1 Tax=Thiomicrorhabdus sp. Kp2 TaxID=1123518 RepID=UPI000412D313|nr:flagellar hook-length control protein FliK [Thiomicrorhabdus sp. Kp2]